MDFSLFEPPAAIRDSVKVIWRVRGTKAEFNTPEPIVPDGCVEIIFNLGDRFINAETGALQPRDLLAGQMTRPVIALPTGDVDLIGVRFHTARAGAALRMPMWELQDQLIEGSSVIPRLNRLAESLAEVTASNRLDHLTEGLRSKLSPATNDASIDHALGLIDQAHGNIAIDAVAKRVGVSRRHLERVFRDRVGLGVKHIARISRIHAALEMLHLRPQLSGAEIAADCGYSDQAHLIRECQEFAGRTPQRLKTTERSLSGLMRQG